jgi:hypothetical protein
MIYLMRYLLLLDIDWPLFDEITGDNNSMIFPFSFPDTQDEYLGVSLGQRYPEADGISDLLPEQRPAPTQTLTIAVQNTPSPSFATVPTEGCVPQQLNPSENFVCDRQECEDEKFTNKTQWK